ncbi:cox cluster protein [Haloferax mediterranei ATCC 33500]|uniref:Cox cluster protein n=1 Tax=Haloferax mediterranei (strain ATCC 33500 / DSM 1411 / JCM 8866 / NBRC 14739 / NCIMB 2177 / R-4) TaxID=523841 RepID=I3R2Y9_HALMT|nr:DUF6684 family protein [Haloferax mediterranei]AFK18599.1 cox cluster protein [Haloferax mediterranei ATCC 33500]AHZ22029.1 cox cluster protein [Haloferax mediterranei ATCC 33500]EMA02126.1 cox cluster protein [Haloferax mediterranei ATCC 33500]MDX5988686.1 DUF6684 family protein [Haloferax mediterranei ATCC 33500]QCQ75097.1 cox cluster protein [Haloferax mediterranei ATCC 33500]
MGTKTFDKDTILDLTVNMVPLVIILFFVVAFALVNPFGFESLASGLQYGLLVTPFVLLAVLTYLSGKAIVGAEQSGTVYPPGQATVPGVGPLHEEEAAEAAELEETNEADAVEAAEETA